MFVLDLALLTALARIPLVAEFKLILCLLSAFRYGGRKDKQTQRQKNEKKGKFEI